MAARDVTSATIYYVHHGETEWNHARRYQGRMDSPLTAEGRRQAERVAHLWARETAGASELALVSSPLGRALATARVIASTLALPIATDKRLAEVSLGEWEGLTNAESAANAAARLAAWLATVRQPTIAVGHGVAGRLLRGLYARLDPVESLRLPIERNGVFILGAGVITFKATEETDND